MLRSRGTKVATTALLTTPRTAVQNGVMGRPAATQQLVPSARLPLPQLCSCSDHDCVLNLLSHSNRDWRTAATQRLLGTMQQRLHSFTFLYQPNLCSGANGTTRETKTNGQICRRSWRLGVQLKKLGQFLPSHKDNQQRTRTFDTQFR